MHVLVLVNEFHRLPLHLKPRPLVSVLLWVVPLVSGSLSFLLLCCTVLVDVGASWLSFNKEHPSERFLGAVTIDALSSWLASAGVAVPPRGTITELDRLVGAYREGGFSRDDIQLAKELAATRHPHDKRSPFYARIMERVNEKGRGFVKTEVARVTKLLSHDMPRAKRAELSNKLVVLDVFDRLLTEVGRGLTQKFFPPMVVVCSP